MFKHESENTGPIILWRDNNVRPKSERTWCYDLLICPDGLINCPDKLINRLDDLLICPDNLLIRPDRLINRTTMSARRLRTKQYRNRMWANAQRNGRPAEYRWRPLFNAAKFG